MYRRTLMALGLLLSLQAISGICVVQGSELDEAGLLGLSSLEPLGEADGLEVRGKAGVAATSGFGLVSGFAFDPATGSSVTIVNSQSSQGFQRGVRSASAASTQVAAVNFNLIVGGSGGFSAIVRGIVQGSGLAFTR